MREGGRECERERGREGGSEREGEREGERERERERESWCSLTCLSHTNHFVRETGYRVIATIITMCLLTLTCGVGTMWLRGCTVRRHGN